MSIVIDVAPWVVAFAAVFLVAWAIQLIIQIAMHRAPLRHARREKIGRTTFSDDQPSVSVVVYAHNQAEELLRNLPVVLDNDYPNFEVIVVDDGSSDFTSDVLTQMQQRSEHFSHTTLAANVRNVSREKMAMMLGVKAAKGDIILMTQAQCMPGSSQWISNMVRQFNNWTDIVLGPVVYELRTGVFNRFYQWDLFERINYTMALTLTCAPYGGSATNIAFRRDLFFANHNECLSGHLNIHPGHDDLFVKAAYRRGNVAVECSAEALVFDQQSPLRYAWRKERLNRAFTSQYYLGRPKALKHLDTVTRYMTVLMGWFLMGYALLLQNWILVAAAFVMLFVHYLLLILTPYQLSKLLGIRRFLVAPVFAELYSPIVDVWFRMRASFNPDQFYVGRINK